MSTALTATPVNTRPSIRIDGQHHMLVDELLQSMTLHEAIGGLASLELTLTDWVSRPRGPPEFAFGDNKILKLGSEIKAYAGDINAPQELFRGRISALESEAVADGPPLITILAEDKLQAARKTRRSETYEQASPADIVRKVAQRHNLTPVIRSGLDQPTGTWVQMNESDLAFLRKTLSQFDADLQVVGDELQAGPRAIDARGKVELRLHDNLLSVRVTVDLAEQTAELCVSGWNPETGAAAKSVATSGELGPGQGRTGAAFVARALDVERRETLGHFGAMSDSEANVMAKAKFGQRARRFVQARGRAEGNAALRVGTWVKLKRINPLFEGEYAVVEAHHSFDQRTGYITEFTAESAYFGGSA